MAVHLNLTPLPPIGSDFKSTQLCLEARHAELVWLQAYGQTLRLVSMFRPSKHREERLAKQRMTSARGRYHDYSRKHSIEQTNAVLSTGDTHATKGH